MVFSSIPFLFFFFTIFLIVYFIIPKKYQNYVLLVFSLIFYAWGEPIYIILMIFTSLVDYIIGKNIEKYNRNEKKRKQFLMFSIVLNLSILGIFKYSDFLIASINDLFNSSIPLLNLRLPIGISFFTFQTISYVIDVYRREVKAEHSYLNYITYVAMFPQLIAGPIVRYETISGELHNRQVNFSKFSSGFLRFMRGLFKKVLIANNVGLLFTIISTTDVGEMSILLAWLGAVAFTLQIYFDFSGYSDMAIGMGKMIGFTYPENFNYPYIANSITSFWRRWHMSLSSWFRDYVYIPLGGNRVSKLINVRNILLVWTLTGLWHGANYNFILWGLYYGVILILEKFVLNKILTRLPNVVRHIYTLFIIIIGWVIFAFDDIELLSRYMKYLFGIGKVNFINSYFIYYFKNYILLIIIGIIFSMPIHIIIKEKIEYFKNKKALFFLSLFLYIILFIITISYLVSDTYNPFLYFRF